MPPWAQRPLCAASAVCGAAPWGFSAADALAALEDGVADTHGDHAFALRGAILATRSRRFVHLMLLSIGGYFA
jgi:hypothetical protein